MSLLDSVLRTIERHRMVPSGGRVIVALSGGPDSVALVHVLRQLGERGALVLAGVAHFNHQLRGAAADEDEQFCREMAAALELPIEVGRADVRAIARVEKRSIEDAGRRLRYAFLHEAAAGLRADAVAVGHSRDDQAETFLLRLVRGAGTRGLGAIRPKAGLIVRPLIDIGRAELRHFAADERLTYRQDATNEDLSVPRNRVRHELLPYLAREFSPGIVEVLAREAALARDDEGKLSAEAIELAASVVLTSNASQGQGALTGCATRTVLDATALRALHPALASRVARIALEPGAGGRFIGFEHIQIFLEFARTAQPGSAVSLPGQQCVHTGDRILLGPEPPRPDRRPVSSATVEAGNFFRFPLSIPGEIVLTGSQMAVSAAWAESAAAPPTADLRLAALVSGVQGPLAVRFRRPGDRFTPPGMSGRARKLQDFLVDRKVARSERDLLPLVVDHDDKIVWIVGHAVAEGRRAASPAPGVILLKAKYLGGEV